jgi:hypothetical protein
METALEKAIGFCKKNDKSLMCKVLGSGLELNFYDLGVRVSAWGRRFGDKGLGSKGFRFIIKPSLRVT